MEKILTMDINKNVRRFCWYLNQCQDNGVWDSINADIGGITLKTGRLIVRLNNNLEIEWINTYGNIDLAEWSEYDGYMAITQKQIDYFKAAESDLTIMCETTE